MFSIYSLMRRRERETDTRRLAAEQTSRAKTIFLSNMSHDIRTPMNAIIGYTNIARRDEMTLPEVRSYLDKIDSSSQHLLSLINDVLEMSRVESGKMELVASECDLTSVMGDVRDMFSEQMAEKSIAFVVDATDVRDPHVLCDARRLDRVLLNLVSNAYKFTPEGGSVTVTLSQIGLAHDGRARFEVRVRDTGIGMSEDFARRVFEPFEREQTSTVSGVEGTGLGMSITKSIVDLMGGTIDVTTAPGKGTEFVVELDLELAPEPDLAAAPADAPASAPTDFSGRRALLVEDNEINRDIATLILRDLGFEVENAENGRNYSQCDSLLLGDTCGAGRGRAGPLRRGPHGRADARHGRLRGDPRHPRPRRPRARGRADCGRHGQRLRGGRPGRARRRHGRPSAQAARRPHAHRRPGRAARRPRRRKGGRGRRAPRLA